MRPVIKVISRAPAAAVDNLFLQWNQYYDQPGKEFYMVSPMGKNAFNEGIKGRMQQCGIEGFTTHGAKRSGQTTAKDQGMTKEQRMELGGNSEGTVRKRTQIALTFCVGISICGTTCYRQNRPQQLAAR
jgi:hypothetical protein